MLTIINTSGTRIIRCSDAAAYPMRSLRETAALGGFLRQRIHASDREQVERDMNVVSNIATTFASNFGNTLKESCKALKYGVLSSDCQMLAENLKTMLASLRAFPELRGIGYEGRCLIGLKSLFEMTFKTEYGSLNYWFDAYVLRRANSELGVNKFIPRGVSVDVVSLAVKSLQAHIKYESMTSANIKSMLDNPADEFSHVCKQGSFLIHVISPNSNEVYQGLMSSFTTNNVVSVPGFGAMTLNIREAAIDSQHRVGVQSFNVTDREIYNEFDLRTTSNARFAERALDLSNRTYNEIMARGINAAPGLAEIAEAYGVANNDSLSSKVILDIGGKRGLNLLQLKNRLKAYGYHKLINQENILEIMKLLASYSSELEKMPCVDLSALFELADDGFRLQYLDTEDADAVLDAAGRLTLALNNSKVNAIPYYAKLPSEIKDESAPKLVLTNSLSVEVSDEDTDATQSNHERDRLMLNNALDGVEREIKALEDRIGAVNAQALNTEVISAQRALDDLITRVVELQGAQSVLNAQAQAILVQVQKVLAYPVISAVYGQELGLVGSYTTINYDTGSREFSVEIDKEAMVARLAKVAYCSTRVKYSCGVYDVYRGDTITPNSWSKRERLERTGSTVDGVRNGYHSVNYMFDAESARNMGVTTSLRKYDLCTRKTKSKFWRKTVEVTPHVSVERYSLTEGDFVNTFKNYLLKILNSEVMKAAAGIAEVIKAAFKAIEAEASTVAKLKSSLAEITNYQDLLGAALAQKRTIEFELALPYDTRPFNATVAFAKKAQDMTDVTQDEGEAEKSSTSIRNKLDCVAFASINLKEIENPNLTDVNRERQNLLQELQSLILDDWDTLSRLPFQGEPAEYADKRYGTITRYYVVRVSVEDELNESNSEKDSEVQVVSDTGLPNEEEEDGTALSGRKILSIGEKKFTIEREYNSILACLDPIIAKGVPLDLNHGSSNEDRNLLDELIESMKYRFPDVEQTIAEYLGGKIDTTVCASKVDRIKEIDSLVASKAENSISITGVETEDSRDVLVVDLDIETEYRFKNKDAVGGYIFDFVLKVKARKYYIWIESRSYPTEGREVLVPFGSVYYNPRSLVRFLYKLGLSNKTTKAVLAKIYDAFGVVDSEQLKNFFDACDLTTREEKVLGSQTEGNVAIDEGRSVAYVLSGLVFLLLDPSDLGLSRILQQETKPIPNPVADDEDASKKRGHFARSVLASCCYDGDDLTL